MIFHWLMISKSKACRKIVWNWSDSTIWYIYECLSVVLTHARIRRKRIGFCSTFWNSKTLFHEKSGNSQLVQIQTWISHATLILKYIQLKWKKSPELLKVTVQYSQGKFPFQWPLTLIITYQIFHGASVQNSEGIMKPSCLSACHLYVTPSFTAALTGL